MPTLLHINVSPRGSHSISRQLSDAAVTEWKAKNPGGRVVERDLAQTPLTFVNFDWIMGAFAPPETHTESHKKALAISDELVAELIAADEVVIGTPMYNFAPPAALKAWIDHVVRAGKTFRYESGGAPVGLLAADKKVVIILASGGNYAEGGGLTAYDHELPYLRFILGFMGLKNVTFIQAGGTGAVSQGKVKAEDFLAPYLKQVAATV
jgi:FMN-dependent NADH-azoreductase